MGPIQTAISKAMGAVGGAAVLGAKLNEKNEGQAAKEATTQTEEKDKKKDVIAKTVKTAQDKKIASPKQVYFWGDSEEPLGTSSEVAYVLSNVSLHNATSSKRRARNKVRERKAMLMKRKLQQRK